MERRTLQGAVLGSLVLLVVVVGCTQGASSHRPIRRAVSDSSSQDDMAVKKICEGTTPCEWAVYVPFVRRVDYVMKNTCVCASDKKCVRTDDDLSVSAYVHRCKTSPESTQIS